MKLKKWLLGLVTFAAMAVLCAVCAGAEEYSSGLWKYTPVGDGKAYITAYSGFDSTLNIPTTLNGYIISGINREAFYGNNNINKVNIPSSIAYIGCRAFAESSITSISIPSTVTDFGADGWNSYSTFENCDKLTTVSFNAKTSVPNEAFCNCDALTTVTIGNSTISVGAIAFKNCTSLVMVKIGNNVESIGEAAFNNTALKSISFPASVNYIGHVAFGNTKLTTVNIPSTVKEFGKSTYWNDNSEPFRECSNLVSVTFNASTSVPSFAFAKCISLKTVYIGNATTGIDNNAFDDCTALKSVTIGEKVEYIGSFAFRNAKSLDSIIGGCNVSKIYGWAFSSCGLKKYSIPEKTIYIGAYAFYDSSLETVVIPSSVTEWGIELSCCRTFASCKNLKTVKIGQSAKPNRNELFWLSNQVKIYCIPGSEAEEYAKNNGISYSATLKSIKSTSIKLNQANYNLKTGETLRLYPTVAPQNTTDRIEWISGNTDIATVDGAGIVTGVSEGTVAIQVKTTSGVSTTCVIEVSDSAITSTDKVVKKNISLATISVANQYYTGKAVKPAPTVKYNDITTLQNGRDYTVTYANNVKVGTAKITIKGIGNYTGTVTKTFKITKLPKVSGAKLGGRAADALRVNWTRNVSADGYIVEMYKNGKWVRAAKITNKNTTTFRKAGLKASTVYKFRVRAYKMIGSVAAYSDYTATITARTNPSVMKGVKIGGKAKDALRVNWTKNTSAQGYIVEMYKGGKWVRVAKITNSNTTTFRKAGLAKNTTYKFRVRAYHMSGKTALYGNYGNVSGRTLVR